MENKHTPGPWVVSDKCVLTSVGDFSAALARGPVTVRRICDCENNPNYVSDAQAEANANLIAAAPDLFDALSEIVASRHSHPETAGCVCIICRARAALKKATGQ